MKINLKNQKCIVVVHYHVIKTEKKKWKKKMRASKLARRTAAAEQACPATVELVQAEELCRFVHPALDESQEWQVHNELKRLVKRQGIQEICSYLQHMRASEKVLLPQSPSAAYAELVRMGMPSGDGFNENTFRKYYMSK